MEITERQIGLKMVGKATEEFITEGVPVAGTSDDEKVRTTKVEEEAAGARATERERSSQGQRNINLMWESTQRLIAISVVEVTLFVVAIVILAPVFTSLFGRSPDQTLVTAAVTGLVLLANLIGNVTGFYFGRTNHEKTGGVGTKEVGR